MCISLTASFKVKARLFLIGQRSDYPGPFFFLSEGVYVWRSYTPSHPCPARQTQDVPFGAGSACVCAL